MDPNHKNPEPTENEAVEADETYTPAVREGADFPNLDSIIEAYTDEEEDPKRN